MNKILECPAHLISHHTKEAPYREGGHHSLTNRKGLNPAPFIWCIDYLPMVGRWMQQCPLSVILGMKRIELGLECCHNQKILPHLSHQPPPPMVRGNNTPISEFLLLGLSEKPELQPVLFGLFLSMYLITVLGNLLIILAVSSDSHLHTPMYFFLSNLSLADICFTSTTIPKMLVNIQIQSKAITYAGCITQMCFFTLFAFLDNFLLAVMAYDRFVAICHPLHYMVTMNAQLCALLVLVSWILSVLGSLLQCLVVLQLSFCPDLQIPHFFCELNQMIQLACSDNFLSNIVMYFATVLLGGVPLAGILYSYFKIVCSIQAIPSAQGKYKAFSTCASHLSVVSLYYGTGLRVYLSSASTHSSQSNAVTSLMYTVVTPMLNPFIYSLRNKDIKGALKRFLVVVVTKGTIILRPKKYSCFLSPKSQNHKL